jgi:hypothetical protein
MFVTRRLSEELAKCVETCNQVYAWYSRREGKYANDETAQSWLRIINEHYNRASVLHYIMHGHYPENGIVPGIEYVPGSPNYRGKAT